MKDQRPIDRRTFLATAGRCSAAAALVSGMGLLVLNDRGDANCVKTSPCRRCSLFTGCTLDRAEDARRTAAGPTPATGAQRA
jgi:hypothetical protein